MKDSSILITGGTGSFGTAFVRRMITTYDPKRLVIFSRDEQKQHALELELKHESLRFFVGDVRDRDRLELAMRGIDVVIHAAAMKIVPTCERDPYECIRTNVFGAENVARAALRMGVDRVIALSTDKAAAPLNLYGASKLAAEKLFVAANSIAAGMTRYSVVRYGNVVGSRGSVIPLFKKLASEGKPLPITHEDMTRFWITLPGAIDFVLSSLDMMRGGEVFVPKLPSMRVIDLANVIGPKLPKAFIGVRPGEKLHETLVTADEARWTVELHDRYMISPAGAEVSGSMPDGFRYGSDNNKHWLTPKKLKEVV
jgi:UDP-N-acetylglucosamine 4,6-dehydratase